tara:strand:- start:1595 stop:3388 length:1794 start_codon:yes stop_codon:yes gene_type:complete
MAALLCLMLVCTTFSFHQDYDKSLLDENLKLQSNSDVTITYSNGPTSGQSLTGLYTLSFTFGGTGTVTSLIVEISDGSTWTSVSTLTSAPWVTYLDTTTYSNGSYTLRATAYDSTESENVIQESESFTIDNQVPVITDFSILNSEYGTGQSTSDRAWFSIATTDTLQFTWNADDDDLLRATLSNVPGPGAPSSDGPTNLNYGWDWASGDFQEGTWNPRLTVHDNSGLSETETMFIGIDRTGPSIGTISTGYTGNWVTSSSVTLSGLVNSVDDGQGSGLSFTEISLDSTTWSQTTSDTYDLTLNDGIHTIDLRAVDNVGNVGQEVQVSIQVDTEDPIATEWIVDELTTSLVGSADVELVAIDTSSGIDISNSFIEYGFDANGFGQTPDISGTWQPSMGSGLDSTVLQSSWATKSRQYLMLRATVTDVAGNSFQTSPVFYQILPSHDLFWNLTETNVDRLVVKPGDDAGNVTVTGLLESNEIYGDSVTVRLESAPADRTAAVSWTVLESKTLSAGTMTDKEELLTWNYTVPSEGQFDLRLVIDPSNVIDEYDENNNINYMVVTGASVSSIINAPSFNPSLGAILVCAFVISLIQRNTRD